MLAGELLTVQAVVLDAQGRVLLQFRTLPPGWEPPGGHVDPGEDPETTVVRETREETGLDVELERLTGYYHFRGIRSGTDAVFRAHVVGGSPRSNREALALRWVDPADLPRALFPWFRERILDAIGEGRSEPVERMQLVGLSHVLGHGLALGAELASAGYSKVGRRFSS